MSNYGKAMNTVNKAEFIAGCAFGMVKLGIEAYGVLNKSEKKNYSNGRNERRGDYRREDRDYR